MSLYYLTAPKQYLHRIEDDSNGNSHNRNDFERDRDRILYSRAFRRLSGKTQVFLSASHDYVRTRLTHTLEVAQISRDIAVALKLDPVLTEAIALGHDIGHTPFGHVGERALNEILNDCHHIFNFQDKLKETDKGFKHNLQSCRTAQTLSRLYNIRNGLNLTNYTLWGMAEHSSRKWNHECPYLEKLLKTDEDGRCRLKLNGERPDCTGKLSVKFYTNEKMNPTNEYAKDTQKPAWSFEAFVVRMADEIAQRHHDLEDALITKIMSPDEVISTFEELFELLDHDPFYEQNKMYLEELKNFKNKSLRPSHESDFMPYVSRFILNVLKNRLITNSKKELADLYSRHNIRSQKSFEKKYLEIEETEYSYAISYDPACQLLDEKLHGILKKRVLNSFHVQRMDGVGTYVIRNLAEAYMANPQQLPDKMIAFLFTVVNGEPRTPRDSQEIGNFRNMIKEMHNSQTQKTFQMKLLRVVCDHIACMTDRYAFAEYQQLYGSIPLRSFDVV